MCGVGGEEDAADAEGGCAALVDAVGSYVEEGVGVWFWVTGEHAFVFGGLVGDYLFWGEGGVFAVGDTPEAVGGDFGGPVRRENGQLLVVGLGKGIGGSFDLHVVIHGIDYEIDIVVAEFLEGVIDLQIVSPFAINNSKHTSRGNEREREIYIRSHNLRIPRLSRKVTPKQRSPNLTIRPITTHKIISFDPLLYPILPLHNCPSFLLTIHNIDDIGVPSHLDITVARNVFEQECSEHAEGEDGECFGVVGVLGNVLDARYGFAADVAPCHVIWY